MRPFLVLGLIALIGCSRGPTLVPVSGRLMKGNDPVADVIVSFLPMDPNAGLLVARCQTDASGKFSLKTIPRDGCIPGAYKVQLQTPESGPAVKQVPGKFQDLTQTPWRVTVPATGITELLLDVTKDEVR